MKKVVIDIHEYQLKLFGLAFSLYALFWSARKALLHFNVDAMYIMQGIGWIALIIFTVALLHYRETIWKKEIKQPTIWTIMLWIMLGLVLITIHIQMERLLILDDIFFLFFTIFLADSYWDFKDAPGAHAEYEI